MNEETIVEIKKGDAKTLQLLYKAYYTHKPKVKPPSHISMREFAFQLFEKESYVRHLSFRSEKELLKYLADKAPKHAYYSVALYNFPDAKSMEEKGWRGSELLFDIDSDAVPDCQSIRIGDDPLVDDSCLYIGFKLAQRVSAMLKRDLGIESTIYFTGNRGFHVLVSSERYLDMSKEEREEIASYVMAEGFDVTKVVLMTRGRRGNIKGELVISPEDLGWRGWIGAELKERGLLQAVRDLSFIESLVAELRVPIDKQVTRDPTRLSRLRGSLNGKASLLVTEINENVFVIGPHLSPFRGEALVKAKDNIPSIKILGEEVELRVGEEVELEAPIAVLLASKGVVELLRGEIRIE
ncbi:MAG: DNA primase small subunit domain-containing protein [Acidilobaceae archaeon]